MYLSELSLKNFRNFIDTEVSDLAPGLSVVVAPNATGKTNFLEAVYVLLRGKSFRASHEECVKWGEEFFTLRGSISGDTTTHLGLQYHTPSRRLRIEEDRNPVSPVSLYTSYPLVLFLPDDTFLFLRGPGMRRNFMNQALGVSTQYLSSIVNYNRVLRQRNGALKRAVDAPDIDNWTELLVEQAESVWASREAFVLFLNHRTGDIYRDLFGGTQVVTVTLSQGLPDGTDLQDALQGAWEYEKRYRYTFYGPHRDDVEVLVDGRPAKAVLSRGQNRLLVVALKLATLQYIVKTTQKVPIVLLDEVLSELDESRQQLLLEHMPTSQVLLTSTEIPQSIVNRSDVKALDLRSILLTEQSKDATVAQETQKEPAHV